MEPRTTMHVKSHAQELTHVSTKPKATKENMYIMTVQKELLRRNTLQHSSFAATSGASDLLLLSRPAR